MENLLIFIFVVALLIAAPFLSILSLNTLFGTGIPINLETWASTFWLHLFFASKVSK